MADHPRYPGTNRLVLIGDTAHDGMGNPPHTGTVISVFVDDTVGLKYSDTLIRHVPVGRLCIGPIGPAPEPIELTIKPTRDKLRTWVAAHDGYGSEPELPRGHIIAAIPADLLAELRAEIEAERQS